MIDKSYQQDLRGQILPVNMPLFLLGLPEDPQGKGDTAEGQVQGSKVYPSFLLTHDQKSLNHLPTFIQTMLHKYYEKKKQGNC